MNYKIMTQIIGNTPIIELQHYTPNKNVKILAKLEGSNPGGSVKDRTAYAMIIQAQQQDLIDKNRTLIEATSGNTGIGLAMLAALFGYKFMAVIPESVSRERCKLLQMYGAQLFLTDGAKGTNYAIEVAQNLVKNSSQYIMIDQFNNQANIQAHYQTTAPEIINEVPQITHFVAGMGTGGTLMGVGKRLKEYNPNIQIIGVEPKENTSIQGLRNMQAYKPAIFDPQKLDDSLNLEDDEIAFELARNIFKKEGLSVGISSGAALWGAIKVAEKIKEGIIVTIFPDRGDRYVSTKLFA